MKHVVVIDLDDPRLRDVRDRLILMSSYIAVPGTDDMALWSETKNMYAPTEDGPLLTGQMLQRLSDFISNARMREGE